MKESPRAGTKPEKDNVIGHDMEYWRSHVNRKRCLFFVVMYRREKLFSSAKNLLIWEGLYIGVRFDFGIAFLLIRI